MSQQFNVQKLWTLLAFLSTLHKLDIKMPGNGVDRLLAMDFAAKYGKKHD